MSRLWTSVRRKAKARHLFIILSLALVPVHYFLGSSVKTTAIPTLPKFNLNYHPPASSQFKSATPVTVALVLCEDATVNDGASNSTKGMRKKFELRVRNFQRQIDQGVVLLKSIVVQEGFFKGSSAVSVVEVLVLSDRFENFQKLDQAIRAEKWAAEFRERIRLTFMPAEYPSGAEWMRGLCRLCATLRLFLDQLLPSYDSVIYIDTDFIFLRPISELWSEFDHFTPENLAALAPCLRHYGTPKNLVPYYGKTGLNAGVILMNLTRIRQADWTTTIRQISNDFSKQTKMADQDILNIYFNATPSKLHVLSCDWNFRAPQCQKEGFCLDPQLGEGISALHGNGLTFTKFGDEPMFHAVFSAFQRFNLTSSSQLKGLTSSLRQRVMQVQRNQKNRSGCVRYEAFPTLLLNRMNLRARQLKEHS